MRARIAFLTLSAVSLHAAHVIYQTNVAANRIASDPSGNAYVLTGSTLVKLDSSGNTVNSKPLSLPGNENAIAADAAGNVYIVGDTNVDTLPTSPSVFQPKRSPGVCIAGDKTAQPYPCPDAFVAKIDPTGSLVWASYLGGLNIDQANSVAVDGSGNIYVTGFTYSSDFPSVNGSQSTFGGYSDAFVTKISGDGTKILYSTFVGADGFDVGHAITVDSAGNAYVAGDIQGQLRTIPSCATTTANYGFILKLTPVGTWAFGSCIGAELSFTEATAVAVDSQGSIYIAGDTNGRLVPYPSPIYSGGINFYANFVTKLTSDGSTFSYRFDFDGASFGVTSIAVDSAGAVYLKGPASATLPPAGPAMEPCPDSAYLLKLNASGSAPLYASFDSFGSMAPGPNGSVILGGQTVERLSALETPADSFLSGECVLNAASLISHVDYGQPGISPGEIVALKGTGLGPLTPPDPIVANGILNNILGGTQVFFDGVAAPLLYVQDGQINAVAPYSLAGKTSTSIQVKYQNQSTTPVTVPVSATSAALFQKPYGTSIVLNQDYSQNSASNPVPRGGALILYLTGAGQTSPPSVDGQIWQTSGALQLPVTAKLTSYGYADAVMSPIPVAYSGPAPGDVSGVQQFNISIPASLPDSFVTPAIGVASVVSLTIGSQQVSFSVYVR